MFDLDVFLPLQEKKESEEFTISGPSNDGDFKPQPQDPFQKQKLTNQDFDDDDVEEETYSEEEIRDVNKIRVNIDDSCPVVLLFGPKGSGKTMALVRLTRFLEDNGYNLEPYRLFRPAHDKHYKKICDDFRHLCYSNYAPGGNDVINFMLVKVLDKYGRPICQILEAPGEHYFDAKFPEQPFPTYIQQIVTELPNKRIWAFIVQKDWNPDTEVMENGEKVDAVLARTEYTQRVQTIRRTKQNRAIFICHKVDASPKTFLPNGRPNTKEFKRQIRLQYGNIFQNWKNRNPLTKWFKPDCFYFVPFSAGAFSTEDSGRTQYIKGDDWYPRMLWKAILKQVKG